MNRKANIIEQLEEDLLLHEGVLLCISSFEAGVLQSFIGSGVCENTRFAKWKIYVSTSWGIEVNDNCCIISEQETEQILEYYRMYEFSNRLKVLEDNAQFGGLLNYYRNGILTQEEFWEAILSEKG